MFVATPYGIVKLLFMLLGGFYIMVVGSAVSAAKYTGAKAAVITDAGVNMFAALLDVCTAAFQLTAAKLRAAAPPPRQIGNGRRRTRRRKNKNKKRKTRGRE